MNRNKREWRMRLQSDWESVAGVFRLFRQTENGEWRMRLRSDWESVAGVFRLFRQTENGEWRMRLWRNNSPFSILHSTPPTSPSTTPALALPSSCYRVHRTSRPQVIPEETADTQNCLRSCVRICIPRCSRGLS
jgi:uncharacterized protein YegP (UPF0339 family)